MNRTGILRVPNCGRDDGEYRIWPPIETMEKPVGKKLNKVYQALLEGAADALKGKELYDFVIKQCPKTSSRRIVKASLFALSDPDVRDRQVLEAIYALAINYRLSSLGVEDDVPDKDDDDAYAPSVSDDLKNRLEGSASKLPIEQMGQGGLLGASDRLTH